MKNRRRGASPRIRLFFAVFLATIILTLAAPYQEVSFSSEIHRPQEQQEPSPPANPAYGTPNGLKGAAASNLDKRVPGPGAFLGAMLGRLAAASAESDAGIKKLAAGIPLIPSDLNKVLVAL